MRLNRDRDRSDKFLTRTLRSRSGYLKIARGNEQRSFSCVDSHISTILNFHTTNILNVFLNPHA